MLPRRSHAAYPPHRRPTRRNHLDDPPTSPSHIAQPRRPPRNGSTVALSGSWALRTPITQRSRTRGAHSAHAHAAVEVVGGSGGEAAVGAHQPGDQRSEERRVGNGSRSRGGREG